MRRAATRWTSWLIGLGLVAAAWAVTVTTPSDDAVDATFSVPARLGVPATGRNFDITVTAVHRADAVSATRSGNSVKAWSAKGSWVVVDLVVAARFETASLYTAALDIDGRTWWASERPESLRSSILQVGVPRVGSVAFELPPAVAGGQATLRLGTLPQGGNLDSELVLPIDLGSVPVQPSVALTPIGWAHP